MLPFAMNQGQHAFPARLVLISTTRAEPLMDEVYDDRESLLDDLAAMTGHVPHEQAQDLADRLLQGESIRVDQTILALFPYAG